MQYYCIYKRDDYNLVMKNTKNKREILNFLRKKGKAYTPYEIANTLEINPVTIYRVLEALQEEKSVHHIPALGKWSACQCEDSSQDHGFLICKKCDSIEEFLSPHQCIHHNGFHCEEHITEVFGECRKCSKQH